MTFNLILLLISPIPWVLPRHLPWLSCHTGLLWRRRNLMSRHAAPCTQVKAHTPTHAHTPKWRKTSWNKTTGTRSDFTGYNRSCETEVERQIGLTRMSRDCKLLELTCYNHSAVFLKITGNCGHRIWPDPQKINVWISSLLPNGTDQRLCSSHCSVCVQEDNTLHWDCEHLCILFPSPLWPLFQSQGQGICNLNTNSV